MTQAGSIPRLIHRVWVSGSPAMPDGFIANGEAWARLHPGWTVRTWTGPEGFTMRNAAIYDAGPPNDLMRYRADLLRLEVLLIHGGLYVDMDVTPLRCVEPLLHGRAAFAAFSPNTWRGQHVISNAIMAAVPGHAWIARCVDTMPDSVLQHRGSFLAMMTGPHHVNRSLRSWDDVHIAGPEAVYPTTPAGTANAYTHHAWANGRGPKAVRV